MQYTLLLAVRMPVVDEVKNKRISDDIIHKRKEREIFIYRIREYSL